MTPSQAITSKTKGLSIAKIFSLFLISIFLFLGVSVYWLIYVRVGDAISDFHEKDIHFYLEANTNALRRYIEDRISLLEDHAKFPVFTNIVMQPERDTANLKDFMNTLSFLGEKWTLAVLDFQGKVIYSTDRVSQDNFATASWPREIITAKQKHHICVIPVSASHGEQYCWQFAVPIIYNTHAEGILLAEYPLDIHFLRQESSFGKEHRLSLFFEDQLVSAIGNVGAESSLMKKRVSGALELVLEVSRSEIQMLKQELLKITLLEIALGTLVFMLIFNFIGRRLFVVPQQDLVSISHELEEINRSLEGEVKIRRETEQFLWEKTEELEASESRLKAILNTAADGIIAISQEGYVQRMNPAAEAIFGYHADEVIGQKVNMLMPEPYHSEHDTYIKNYITTGHRRIIGIGREVRGRRKDGTTFPLRLSVGEAHLGKQRFFNGIISDLTERKRVEDELTRLSLVAKKTDNAVIITDKHGFAEWVNEGFTRITGYDFDEIIGKKPGEILQGPLTNPETVEDIRKALREKRSFTGEILNYHKDGHPHWISMSLTPILDEHGNVVRYIGIESDISDKKLAEKELQEAKADAEAASHAKSDFLASMSHEIRTPMNTIIGMADLLCETSLNPEQKQYVKVFQSSGETLLGLINDILDLSKIEAGRLSLEKIAFDLGDMFQELHEAFIARAREKGIDLDFTLTPGAPVALTGDSIRLRQILVNLIGNALKFTEKGKIAVKAGLETDEAEKNVEYEEDKPFSLIFSVSDTGIGIPPEKLDMIFEEFTQADTSTTRKYGGTGLGLTISTQLADLMGGRIWAESSVGQGTTFYFTIQAEDQRDIDKAIQKPAVASIDLEALGPLRILLVEDFPDNRLLILSYLKKTACQTDIAENGEIAVEMFRSAKYDLVFMDMQMPIMDGYTATRKIREWEQEQLLSPTPIIALTAHALKEDTQKSLDAGCTSHLTKPLRKAELLQSIVEQTGGTGGMPSDHTEQNDTEENEKIVAYVDEDLEELIPGFLENRKKDIRTMESALDQEDYETIRTLGHSMKGAGGSYGFDGITDIGKYLETAAKVKESDEIRKLIGNLSAYLENVEIIYE